MLLCYYYYNSMYEMVDFGWILRETYICTFKYLTNDTVKAPVASVMLTL